MPDTAPYEFLVALQEEPGILKPPLTAEQIQAALLFGSAFYKAPESFENDPYTQWLPKARLLLTLGTAFGRIAAYGGACARTGEKTDPSIIEQINFHPMFETHYWMQAMSKHKFVSCIVVGGTSQMENLERERHDRRYTETWSFPYPENPWDLVAYEVFIPRFLFLGRKEQCVFDFEILR